MNDLVYPDYIQKHNTLRPQADSVWIDDCFTSYSIEVINIIDEYFICVNKLDYGIVISSEYDIAVLPWFVEIDIENQTGYCNGGKMVSIVFTHLQSRRAFKVDLSSFSDMLVFTTYNKLILHDNNEVAIGASIAVFKGVCDLYQLNNIDLLSKIYNFLQFNVTDVELNQQLINLH